MITGTVIITCRGRGAIGDLDDRAWTDMWRGLIKAKGLPARIDIGDAVIAYVPLLLDLAEVAAECASVEICGSNADSVRRLISALRNRTQAAI